MARIQSVSYIPTYSDGKATVKKYNGSTSQVTLDFEISPKDAVVELAKVWQSAVSVKAVYTQTRAVSFVDMPIVKFEADATNGVITVTASGENLSAEFFAGTQEVSCRLAISDGNNSVTSEYVSLVAEDIFAGNLLTIPNDEIWYVNGSTTEATIPDSITTFGADIISNTYDTEKECWVIKFDGDISSIGDYAFNKCTSLTKIGIPESVTSIGDYAFNKCTSLANIEIPDNVTSIGAWAFWHCHSITSITIPNNVDTIKECAFRECSSLRMFYGKFASEDGLCLIVDGVLTAFANGCRISEYSIPNSVISIGNNAFRRCTTLNRITIHGDVISIGVSAFESCIGLTNIAILDGVTSINDWCFKDCPSLVSITIPDSVTSIRKEAFRGCTSLTSVTIPDSVTSIGEYAFYDCTSLTSVTIGDGVTSIGEDAFHGCNSLRSVHITDLSAWCKIDFEGYYANPLPYAKRLFLNNSVVTNLTIPSDITEIKKYAFRNCTSLTSITIPDSVTSIGQEAFEDCTSLTSVTILDSVTSIGGWAFNGCSSLTRVYCKPTTPPTGGGSMFSNNASGIKIYVPRNSVSAYKTASYWRNYASSIVGYDF